MFSGQGGTQGNALSGEPRLGTINNCPRLVVLLTSNYFQAEAFWETMSCFTNIFVQMSLNHQIDTVIKSKYRSFHYQQKTYVYIYIFIYDIHIMYMGGGFKHVLT